MSYNYVSDTEALHWPSVNNFKKEVAAMRFCEGGLGKNFIGAASKCGTNLVESSNRSRKSRTLFASKTCQTDEAAQAAQAAQATNEASAANIAATEEAASNERMPGGPSSKCRKNENKNEDEDDDFDNENDSFEDFEMEVQIVASTNCRTAIHQIRSFTFDKDDSISVSSISSNEFILSPKSQGEILLQSIQKPAFEAKRNSQTCKSSSRSAHPFADLDLVDLTMHENQDINNNNDTIPPMGEFLYSEETNSTKDEMPNGNRNHDDPDESNLSNSNVCLKCLKRMNTDDNCSDKDFQTTEERYIYLNGSRHTDAPVSKAKAHSHFHSPKNFNQEMHQKSSLDNVPSQSSFSRKSLSRTDQQPNSAEDLSRRSKNVKRSFVTNKRNDPRKHFSSSDQNDSRSSKSYEISNSNVSEGGGYPRNHGGYGRGLPTHPDPYYRYPLFSQLRNLPVNNHGFWPYINTLKNRNLLPDPLGIFNNTNYYLGGQVPVRNFYNDVMPMNSWPLMVNGGLPFYNNYVNNSCFYRLPYGGYPLMPHIPPIPPIPQMTPQYSQMPPMPPMPPMSQMTQFPQIPPMPPMPPVPLLSSVSENLMNNYNSTIINSTTYHSLNIQNQRAGLNAASSLSSANSPLNSVRNSTDAANVLSSILKDTKSPTDIGRFPGKISNEGEEDNAEPENENQITLERSDLVKELQEEEIFQGDYCVPISFSEIIDKFEKLDLNNESLGGNDDGAKSEASDKDFERSGSEGANESLHINFSFESGGTLDESLPDPSKAKNSENEDIMWVSNVKTFHNYLDSTNLPELPNFSIETVDDLSQVPPPQPFESSLSLLMESFWNERPFELPSYIEQASTSVQSKWQQSLKDGTIVEFKPAVNSTNVGGMEFPNCSFNADLYSPISNLGQSFSCQNEISSGNQEDQYDFPDLTILPDENLSINTGDIPVMEASSLSPISNPRMISFGDFETDPTDISHEVFFNSTQISEIASFPINKLLLKGTKKQQPPIPADMENQVITLGNCTSATFPTNTVDFREYISQDDKDVEKAFEQFNLNNFDPCKRNDEGLQVANDNFLRKNNEDNSWKLCLEFDNNDLNEARNKFLNKNFENKNCKSIRISATISSDKVLVAESNKIIAPCDIICKNQQDGNLSSSSSQSEGSLTFKTDGGDHTDLLFFNNDDLPSSSTASALRKSFSPSKMPNENVQAFFDGREMGAFSGDSDNSENGNSFISSRGCIELCSLPNSDPNDAQNLSNLLASNACSIQIEISGISPDSPIPNPIYAHDYACYDVETFYTTTTIINANNANGNGNGNNLQQTTAPSEVAPQHLEASCENNIPETIKVENLHLNGNFGLGVGSSETDETEEKEEKSIYGIKNGWVKKVSKEISMGLLRKPMEKFFQEYEETMTNKDKVAEETIQANGRFNNENGMASVNLFDVSFLADSSAANDDIIDKTSDEAEEEDTSAPRQNGDIEAAHPNNFQN